MFSKTNTRTETIAETPKRPTSRPNASGIPSILAADLLITGEIVTDGDVQVEGRLDGNISAATLTIGEQGAVNGTIKAGTVLIRGKVTGKINAGSVELAETANVQADIVQDHLSIANGAFFDGKCSRKTKPAKVATATPKAKAAAKKA
ncbi:MAG: polymer-forming cytoskeletal protein [Robiginitomaculum sp.]